MNIQLSQRKIRWTSALFSMVEPFEYSRFLSKSSQKRSSFRRDFNGLSVRKLVRCKRFFFHDLRANCYRHWRLSNTAPTVPTSSFIMQRTTSIFDQTVVIRQSQLLVNYQSIIAEKFTGDDQWNSLQRVIAGFGRPDRLRSKLCRYFSEGGKNTRPVRCSSQSLAR